MKHWGTSKLGLGLGCKGFRPLPPPPKLERRYYHRYLGAAEHMKYAAPGAPGSPNPLETRPGGPGTVHIHIFGGARVSANHR
jgi:hypothetical protein